LICRPFFKKLILHWHVAGLAKWLETAVSIRTRSLTYRLMKNADLSIVLSEFNRRDAEKLTAARIATVNIGAPDPCPQFERDLLPRRRARIGARKKLLAGESPSAGDPESAASVNVLYLARCTREKGLFDVVEGVALANEKLAARNSPLRFRLTLIGVFASSAEENELRELIERRCLRQTVECLGLVSAGRKEQALRDADLFCFPTHSRTEPQPFNLIEAMAFGLPIITTRCRSLLEILPENYPGLVDPGSPAQVADMLSAMMTQETGVKLRENFLNHFTLYRHLADLAQCIHSLESPGSISLLEPRPQNKLPAGVKPPGFEFGITPAPATLKLALTILAENPSRKTGLSTLFHEFVSRSLSLFPDVSWLIFAGPNQDWKITDPRVELVRDFPANDRLNRRLFADHFQVPAVARKRGAQVLLTVGFVPVRKCLPTVLHVLSLQTLDKRNRLGFLRQIYRNSIMKYNWPQADLVITNSQWTANEVLTIYPQFFDRLVVSYEGLQHEIFHPAPAEDEAARLKEKFGLEPGYLLWVSNFYPYKQAELLIAGYARLDPETRRRHPLVMVGGNWLNGLEATQAQARALGLEKDVRYLNWVDDAMLAPLYRQAAVFCLASREETFGRCVIEAMACGAPCVVNDIPIMHEVTAGHALIINYHDAAVVAAALRKLVTDDVLTAHLRASGLTRVREFTFEKLTTERITAIRRLVAARR
jgi:glycosyltransferase involved in cell wall biosynthesis